MSAYYSNIYIFFFSTVAPRLIKVPDRFLPIEKGSTATVTCEAFGYPPSAITWTRAFGGLPKERTSVKNGTLSIENFSKEDSGTYVCTARNHLGSVSAATTLGFQRKPGNCKISKPLYAASSFSVSRLRLIFLFFSFVALKRTGHYLKNFEHYYYYYNISHQHTLNCFRFLCYKN